ncbi:MAG: DNA polymerase III subunit beta [Xanthobacteraceae bacterium]
MAIRSRWRIVRTARKEIGPAEADETIAKLQAYAPAIASQGDRALFMGRRPGTKPDQKAISICLSITIPAAASAFDLVGLKLFIEGHLGVPSTSTRDGLHPALRSRIEKSAVRVF